MVDWRGDSVHTCYSGHRPWSTAIAEENGWTDGLRHSSVHFFLIQRFLAVFSLPHTCHQHAATDEMGVRMGRPPFLHYVSSGMGDNIGVDGPNLATLQG